MARGLAFARVQQHDRLACAPRRAGQFDEAGGLAKLLDDHRDDMGVRVIDQPADIIFNAAGRLIAGRDGIADRQLAGEERGRQHRRHRARLRDDADRARAFGSDAQRFDEGQRCGRDMVDEAEAVWPLDDHASGRRDCRDFGLFGGAFGATFGKACRKDDRRAHAPPCERAQPIQHTAARDSQHRDIDALWQRLDRGQAGPRADRLALGIDRVDVARIAIAIKVGDDRGAQRPRLVAGAHHRDGAGRQQLCDCGAGQRLRARHGGFSP